MRTSALQYLYLQKPVSSIILICIISVLPWLFNHSYTAEEVRSTEVGNTILTSGDWILPKTSAGEKLYQPPMTDWLITAVSFPQGNVSIFTVRLPSALAFVVSLVFILLFFGRYLRFQEAFITVLLLVTCFRVYWTGANAGINMVYMAFVLIGLFKMFRWENKLELRGLPIIIPLMLSGAILTKGIIGVIYPLIIFGCYLFLLRKYTPFRIAKSLFYIGLTSLFIPLIWYIEGWRQGEADFLKIALSEDFQGLFLAGDICNLSLVGRNLLSFFVGFLPWTVLLFCSLFGLSKRDFEPVDLIENDREEMQIRKKVKLFSCIAAVGFVFLGLLSGNITPSDYLPAYPFIGIFIAQYIIYLAENRSYVIRIFAGLLATIVSVAIILIVLILTNRIDIIHIAASYISGGDLEAVKMIVSSISFDNIWFVVLLALTLGALVTTYYQMMRKINLKILYATIFLVFCSYLFMDVIVVKFLV